MDLEEGNGPIAVRDSTTDGTRRGVRAVAFYLPQFHPIPENDEWWGRGFTEWTNVARAKPLYRGHWQPNLPADLGFYDLRIPEVRAAQAQMASAHGFEGFLYWHYWFAGRRLLDRPFREVLQTGEPNFGFCLGWANESWTGIWHGAANRVLVEQTYPGLDDYVAHFHHIVPALHDPRYLKVDGQPIFYIYRPSQIPDLGAFVECWQNLASREGLRGLYFIGESIGPHDEALGRMDAVVKNPKSELGRRSTRSRLRSRLMKVARGGPTVLPYEFLADLPYEDAASVQPMLPCVISNWDNTPRTGRNGVVYHGSTPELFERALENAVAAVEDLPPTKRLVFVKSWNEWAEGNYLEPDQRFGSRYLQVARDVLVSSKGRASLPQT